MNLLIDTHTLIWYIEKSDEISRLGKTAIESAENVYVSIASLWEIAIKINLGKLVLASAFENLQTVLIEAKIEMLPITFADAKRYIGLPLHHRDPFDRMLAAQTVERGWTIVSRDEIFDRYGANRLW